MVNWQNVTNMKMADIIIISCLRMFSALSLERKKNFCKNWDSCKIYIHSFFSFHLQQCVAHLQGWYISAHIKLFIVNLRNSDLIFYSLLDFFSFLQTRNNRWHQKEVVYLLIRFYDIFSQKALRLYAKSKYK